MAWHLQKKERTRSATSDMAYLAAICTTSLSAKPEQAMRIFDDATIWQAMFMMLPRFAPKNQHRKTRARMPSLEAQARCLVLGSLLVPVIPLPAMHAQGTAPPRGNQDGDRSPLDFGAKCDAVEVPVMQNSIYLYSKGSGTDDTAAFRAWAAALGTTVPARVPIGASAELQAHTIFQGVGRLPAGRACLLTSFPALPDGLRLEGNNATLLISSPGGSGPVFRNINGGNTPGTDNDALLNFRVVYVGPPGESTGAGAGFMLGGHEQMHGVSAFGFNIGGLLAGVEYSQISGNFFAWNSVGLALVAGGYTDHAYIDIVQGFPTLDNTLESNTLRNNKVNYWLDGGNTNHIGASHNGFASVADVVMGALDFPYIDTLAIKDANAAICTANATIPLLITDPDATLPAEAILVTDAHGHPTGAYSVNGGKGYVQANTSVRVPTGSPGCRTPPVVTVHVASMAGVVPQTGGRRGASQNYIDYADMEGEGTDAAGHMGRPNTGFQVILDATASDNVFLRPVTGIGTGTPQGFARFMRNEGGNNLVLYPLIPQNPPDPLTGAACPFMNTGSLDLRFSRGTLDAATATCDGNGRTRADVHTAFTGWDDAINFMAHGFAGYGTSPQNAPFDLLLKGQEPGDTKPRTFLTQSGSLDLGPGGDLPFDVAVGRTGRGTYGLVQTTDGASGYVSNWPMTTTLNDGSHPTGCHMAAGNAAPVWECQRWTGSGANYFWTRYGTRPDEAAGGEDLFLQDCGQGPSPGTCTDTFVVNPRTGLQLGGARGFTGSCPPTATLTVKGGLITGCK